jgi:hypothetical protein
MPLFLQPASAMAVDAVGIRNPPFRTKPQATAAAQCRLRQQNLSVAAVTAPTVNGHHNRYMSPFIYFNVTRASSISGGCLRGFVLRMLLAFSQIYFTPIMLTSVLYLPIVFGKCCGFLLIYAEPTEHYPYATRVVTAADRATVA